MIRQNAGGGLLIGGDWPGYYDSISAIKIGTPESALFGISLALSFQDYYVAFYLFLFLELVLLSLSILYFVSSVVMNNVEKETVGAIALVCFVLFLFNPTSVIDTFKSLIGTANIVNSGFFLFLGGTARLALSFVRVKEFTRKDGAILGVGIALSTGVPPDSIRLVVLEGLIALGALLLICFYLFLRDEFHPGKLVKELSRRALVPVLVAILCMSYWTIPLLLNLAPQLSAFHQATEVRYGVLGKDILMPSYATLPQVIRLFGEWTFPSGFMPYHDIYSAFWPTVISSFLWPIMALALPLLLSRGRERLIMLVILSGMLLFIMWDKAGNPPLGFLFVATVQTFPFLISLFPTSFLTLIVLSKIFAFSGAFSIVRIGHLSSKIGKIPTRFKRLTNIIVIVALTTLLLVTSIPIFDGSAESQYFDSSVRGIFVPQEYSEARDLLLSGAGQRAPIVSFWPSLSTYLTTSWGYQGTNAFYNRFFAPLTILTPDKVVGYGTYDNTRIQNYRELTIPALSPDPASRSDLNYLVNSSNIVVAHAHERRNGTEITILDIGKTDDSPWVDVIVPFIEPVNLTSSRILNLEFGTTDASVFSGLVSSSGIWIGVSSIDGSVGWYIIGSATSTFEIGSDSLIDINLVIGHPDKPWASSEYNASSVNALILRFIREKVSPNEELTLSDLGLSAYQAVHLSQSTLLTWREFGLQYVMLDKTVIDGLGISYDYYNILFDSGALRDRLTMISSNKICDVFRVNLDVT
jgi:hypothetical protein